MGNHYQGGDAFSDTVHLKEPIACTDGERREFARLVCEGFHAARNLEGRIRNAKWLAFYYPAGEALAAVAAIKRPTERYRDDVFRKAAAPASPADYQLELGWVYVTPAYRGNRIAERLCRLLLARVFTSPAFATTRTNNRAMTRILLALGFARAGRPYPRRNERLVLFLRSSSPLPAPGTAA